MEYADGRTIALGDIVALGDDHAGVVVACISDGVFSRSHPREAWDHLETGLLVVFPTFGLIHYERPEDDLMLVARADETPRKDEP